MSTEAWLGVGLGVLACLACLFVGRLLHVAKPHHHRAHEDQAQREWVRSQALKRIRAKQPDVVEVVDLREPAQEKDEPPALT